VIRDAVISGPCKTLNKRARALRAMLAAALCGAALGLGAAVVLAQTGLPLPRFVSLRADEVNVRTGPGIRYPIEWVFKRRDMPVEITAEFDTWRKIRDWEGTEGWVHQSMLSGKRTVLISGGRQTLRREPDLAAPAVAHADPLVVGELKDCRGTWCRIRVAGYEGWLRKDQFWGVYANETVE